MIMLHQNGQKPKLLTVFITLSTVGIIIVGYLFNLFQFHFNLIFRR